MRNMKYTILLLQKIRKLNITTKYLQIFIIVLKRIKYSVIFYKYFIPLLNKNRLVDEKFIKDYNNYQKVIRSFYT